MKHLLLASKFLLLFFAVCFFTTSNAQKAGNRSFYQISVYHFKDTAQGSAISNYLRYAFVPALHRMNRKNIGVFCAVNNDTAADKTMYVLLPVQSLAESAALADKLSTDPEYLKAGSRYLNAPYDTAPYTRMETILLQAFPMAPSIQKPQVKAANKDRIYELRSYEGATEKLHASKVKMFNTGDEVGIFKDLNFNAVFYAEVIAGSHMPNLMYMTTFENMADREEHWKQFFNDERFKKLGTMPEYQHNVSHADIIFLHAADYSDL